MKRAVSFLVTVYASVPVLLYLFPWILGHAIFAHLLRLPFFVDLGRPGDIVNHTCNFYLDTEEDVSVGVWHTLPASQWKEAVGKSPEWYRETLGDGHPVIVYLHGNIGTRWDESGGIETLEFILMESSGYYMTVQSSKRFGDSSGEPSEAGLTSDALYLYQWVKERSRGSLVCLWGHSLGSGVATNAAVKLQEKGGLKVTNRILQKYFSENLNPLFLQMYMFLPGFQSLLWNTLDKNNIEFANDKNLKTLTGPLLILHAEDDNVVPYHMGLKVQLVLHSKWMFANRGFSHSNIYLDPDLPNVVR
uniref:AB hydrolase-1 domain-containing protein n=1 Tax=Echeneis naucrates TaxID=173247 RepID=A0A665TSG0_ECHNA